MLQDYYVISADLFKNIRKIKILYYLVKEFPKKDCDDEDDCGSAADVFNNDGSGDGMVKDKVIHVQIVTDMNYLHTWAYGPYLIWGGTLLFARQDLWNDI